MVGKITVLNIVPLKLFTLVRRMERDLEAAYQVYQNMRHMDPDTADLAEAAGLNPEETIKEMNTIMDNIEVRMDAIFSMVKHMNEYPEEVGEELMEGFIYGTQLDDPGAGAI